MTPWTLVASTYRDTEVLERNLMRSPALTDAAEVIIKRDCETVCQAYNQALRESAHDVVVFAHPDVYLPSHWGSALQDALAWLDQNDSGWGVLGLFGSTREGRYAGFTYSVGIGSFIGVPYKQPIPVRTVDEFVFIVRRSSGLVFDEQLPGAQSQLCATDVCLDAERRGCGVYVIPAFALHNSNGWSYLPMPFWKPYLYMRRKWSAALPVYVPYARITRWCIPMFKNSARAIRRGIANGHRTNSRAADVVARYEALRCDAAYAIGVDPNQRCDMASEFARQG